MPLDLKIVTPESEALHTTCDEVTIPGLTGEIGFGPGHVPLITVLKPGVLTVLKGTQRTIYAISSGFAEIESGTVTVLTQSCQSGSKIDVDQAKLEVAEAEKALADLSEYHPNYTVVRGRLDRALARINAAQLRK
ncbi:MAG: ATP synthase F1 subunit epsilon [Myxococcales bacterium]|nr:ATP synthase F1 subunit epsilon [Myxococcales bacterium]